MSRVGSRVGCSFEVHVQLSGAFLLDRLLSQLPSSRIARWAALRSLKLPTGTPIEWAAGPRVP